jgi:tetratricopeptide (TPR) repeat protein
MVKIKSFVLFLSSSLISILAFSPASAQEPSTSEVNREIDKIDDLFEFVNSLPSASEPSRHKILFYLPYNRLNVVEAERILRDNEGNPSVTSLMHEYLCAAALHPKSIIARKAVLYCEKAAKNLEEFIESEGSDWGRKYQSVNSSLILSLAHLREGDFEESTRLIESFLNELPSDWSYQGKAFLGDFYFETGDYKSAILNYRYYLDGRNKEERKNGREFYDLDNNEIFSGVPNVRLNYALSLVRTGQYRKAEEMLLDEIEAFESKIESGYGLSDSEVILGYSNYGDRLYSALQESKVEQGKYKEALEIAERSRAQDLLFKSRLAQFSTIKSQSKNDFSLEIITEEARLQDSTIVFYSIIPKGTWHDEEIFIWVIKPDGKISFKREDLSYDQLISGDKNNFSAFFQKLTSIFRNFFDFLFKRGINTVENESVNKETIDNFAISFSDMIERSSANISEARGIFSESSWNNMCDQESCNSIFYSALIHPIERLLPKSSDEEVVIIPHQKIYLVPFYALKDLNGEYLIENYTFRFSPSIKFLELSREIAENTSKWPQKNLVVGNPNMPYVENLLRQPEIYESLPFAELEAKTVASHLNAQPLIRSDATESLIKEEIQNVGIAHFATHGILDSVVNQNKVSNALALAALLGSR